MKTKAPAIPEAVKMYVLSSHIDWSDKQRPQFHYTVELTYQGRRMQVPYSGGILAFVDRAAMRQSTARNRGNVPYMNAAEKILAGASLKYSPEDPGDVAACAVKFIFNHSKPDLAGVLYSLVMDASGCEQDFEEWAADLGYNPDSIKDKAVWETCRKQTKEFRALVGPLFDEIAATLEDY